MRAVTSTRSCLSGLAVENGAVAPLHPVDMVHVPLLHTECPLHTGIQIVQCTMYMLAGQLPTKHNKPE